MAASDSCPAISQKTLICLLTLLLNRDQDGSSVKIKLALAKGWQAARSQSRVVTEMRLAHDASLEARSDRSQRRGWCRAVSCKEPPAEISQNPSHTPVAKASSTLTPSIFVTGRNEPNGLPCARPQGRPFVHGLSWRSLQLAKRWMFCGLDTSQVAGAPRSITTNCRDQVSGSRRSHRN